MIPVTTHKKFPTPQELGYDRDMPRFIALYWEPMGDELASYDGRNTTVGMLDNWKFLTWKQAALMEGHILEIGDCDREAMYWLIYDNVDNLLYLEPSAEAASFIEAQWPEREEFPYGEFPNYAEIVDPDYQDNLAEIARDTYRQLHGDDPEDTLQLKGVAREFPTIYRDDPTPTIKFRWDLTILPFCTCLVPEITLARIDHCLKCQKPLLGRR